MTKHAGIVIPFDDSAGIDTVAALDGDLTGEVQVVVSDRSAFTFIVNQVAVVVVTVTVLGRFYAFGGACACGAVRYGVQAGLVCIVLVGQVIDRAVFIQELAVFVASAECAVAVQGSEVSDFVVVDRPFIVMSPVVVGSVFGDLCVEDMP